MDGTQRQADGEGALHGIKGQGLLGEHGARPHTPLRRMENGWRARAGGRRRGVAWGKRSRALGEHEAKPPYPLYGEAGAFAYQNKNSFHLYMACKNAGPCQHLLFGKTVFGGACRADKFCFLLFRARRGKHKLRQHLPFDKTISSDACGIDKFCFPLFRALRGVHNLCQHLLSGKTIFSGAGGTERFRRSIIRVRK